MPAILIVDDEAPIRALLSAVFVRAGYEVQVASDGTEAMAVCAARSFDVLLSDVAMPEMNGHELARWVAVNHPATRTVLMSGYDIGCQKCGYSPRCKLVTKPFLPRDVVKAVEGALEWSDVVMPVSA